MGEEGGGERGELHRVYSRWGDILHSPWGNTILCTVVLPSLCGFLCLWYCMASLSQRASGEWPDGIEGAWPMGNGGNGGMPWRIVFDRGGASNESDVRGWYGKESCAGGLGRGCGEE